MKTKCLIVDDEPIAQEIIRNYIKKLNTLEVVGECSNALEAFQFLQKEKVDLIFLDIQMPQITGLDFLKSLKSPPRVIIVSAYREFAIEGFDLDVVDYLLKPVSLDRFLRAIDRFYQFQKMEQATSHPKESIAYQVPERHIWVRADRKNIRISTSKIRYIEGLKDYVKIYLDDGMVISKVTMKEMEESLPEEDFIRVHRSYIVSRGKIKAYTHEHVEIDRNILPIGNSYKKAVLSIFK